MLNVEVARKKGKKVSEIIFILAMLAVPIASFLLFWLYVNLNSILLAFQRPIIGGGISWGLANFEVFAHEFLQRDGIIVSALINTLIFFITNMLFILPISILICYFFYKKLHGYRVFRFILFLPSIISVTVFAALFKYIIAANGPLGILYEMVFSKQIPDFFANSSYALKTILFYCIVTSFGGNIILINGAMIRIDDAIIEAGKIDGVGMFREIFQIIIPLIWPTISTMILLAMVGIFTASGPILLFTKGGYNTYTISYWIFEQVYENQAYEYASAVGLVFTALGLPIVLGAKAILNKLLEATEY